MSQHSWKTLSSRLIYDNAWIQLEEHQVINPSGKNGIYGKVHFKNLAIGIVPLDNEQHIYLVGQFRYTLQAWSWEIPEGGGLLGIDPLDSAKRELEEETGLRATQWQLIVTSHLSNSVTDEKGYIYLARGLSQHAIKTEETEADMKVWKLPFSQALAMVESGEITDSLTIMGILKTARLLA